MRARSVDLLAAAALALAATVAVALGAPVAVCTLLGVPLVLLAPGYVWADVLFGSTLGTDIRAAVSVALSLTVTAVGGIGLYLAGVRLDRYSWLALLAATTLVGAAVAGTLRRRVVLAPPDGSGGRPGVQRISLTQGVRLGLATLIAAAAVGIAVHSANAQVQPAFTQLSLGRPTGGSVQIVVVNHEHSSQQYQIVVATDGITSRRWTVTVTDGSGWQGSVPVRPGQRLAVNLYKNTISGPPYRFVTMRIPG